MKMMSARDKKKDYLVPRLRFPEFRDTGEWGKVQLSKIAIPVSERATDGDADAVLTLSAEHGVVTQGSYFGKKIAGDDVTRYIKIKNNDFVYNDRTTKFYKYGSIKRLSRHTYGIVSPIYKCFRFNDEEIPVFWEWYFESGEHDTQLHNIVNEGAKAGRFNISIQKFLSIFVYFPDKSEQQRIADCLSSLDERIAAETTKLDRLKDHKNGLLKQLFPAEGETLPQLRFPEFRNAGEWENVQLGPQTTKVGSGVTPRGGDRNYIKQGRPFIRSQNVGWGELILDDIVFISEEIHRTFISTEIEKNDILLNITGASIGRSAFADSRIAGGNVNQHVCIIRTKPSLLNSLFLMQYILSEYGQKQVDSFQAGGNRQGLNFAQVKSFSIPTPPQSTVMQCACLEQQRIADCLSSLDELIAAQTQKIDLLNEHKKGLMQQLFPRIDEVLA